MSGGGSAERGDGSDAGGGPETLELSRHEPVEVVARMAELAAAHRGWINLRPVVDEEHDVPAARPGIFSGLGPAVPLCTWTPGERRRRGVEPASIGIQHQTGPKVAARLARLGHPVPPLWRVVQDHSRRGLVVQLPPEPDHREVVDWLLLAGELLCLVPTSDRWVAVVFS